MATASITNTFVAGTAAQAAQVNTNFTNLVTFLNNSVVHRDGSKAMTANLDAGTNKIINLDAGTADTDAVNYGQISAATSPLPLGVVAYAERTSSVSSISTTQTDITDLTVTFTAVAGRRYRVTHSSLWTASVDGSGVGVNLYNSTSGTVLQESLAQRLLTAGSGRDAALGLEWSGSLSAGSVTLKMRGVRTTGSGTVAMSAASTAPAFILVEDIGLA